MICFCPRSDPCFFNITNTLIMHIKMYIFGHVYILTEFSPVVKAFLFFKVHIFTVQLYYIQQTQSIIGVCLTVK